MADIQDVLSDYSVNQGRVSWNNSIRELEQRNAAEATARADADTAEREAREAHVADIANPHSVTASQAGAHPNTWLPTWGQVGGKPTAFNPTAHKASHATGGADAIAPGDIGAAPSSHVGAGGDAHAVATYGAAGFVTETQHARIEGLRKDVREFGPTGTPTETRATFQAALDSNYSISVPEQTFSVDGPLQLHMGSSLRGQAPFHTRYSMIETLDNTYNLFDVDEDAQWVDVQDLWLHCAASAFPSGTTPPNHAFRLNSVRAGFNHTYKRLRITRFHTAYRADYGWWNGSLRDVTIANVIRGFTVLGSGSSVSGAGDAIIQMLFDTVYVSEFREYAYDLNSVDNYLFLNCNNGGNTDADANGVKNKNPFYMRLRGKCSATNILNTNFEKSILPASDGSAGAALIVKDDSEVSVRDCRFLLNTGETNSYQVHALGNARVLIDNMFCGPDDGTASSEPTRDLRVSQNARVSLRQFYPRHAPVCDSGATFAANIRHLDAPHSRNLSSDAMTGYDITLTANTLTQLTAPVISLPALGAPPKGMKYRAKIGGQLRVSSGPATNLFLHTGFGSALAAPAGGGYRGGGDELYQVSLALDVPSTSHTSASTVNFGITARDAGTYRISGAPRPDVTIECVPI